MVTGEEYVGGIAGIKCEFVYISNLQNFGVVSALDRYGEIYGSLHQHGTNPA